MKYYTITREQVQAMIDDVNESITAVTEATITETATAIQDTITTDCVWSSTDVDVTFGSLIACVEEWLADRTEPAAPAILDSSVAAAVSSMMNAIEECHEPDAARRTAEIVSAKIKTSGGETWINPMWYGVDQIDTSAPVGRYGNPRGFEYIKWPRAQVRDVVEYEGKAYRVVANYVSPGKAGQWVSQFSFYAIMPIEVTV
jgi:hypothetical protein